MARLQLNKSSLAKQQTQLKSYQRFLPSLDLKRQQLIGERAKALEDVAQLEARVKTFAAKVGDDLPMLANSDISLDGLVRLTDYQLAQENVVGTKLPKLDRIEVEVAEYSPLAKPHWVDDVARLLHDMLEARLQVQIAKQRVVLLDKAVKTITQRVNLFDKVLIPRARGNIKKIGISLNDEEMASMVRSKISKRKRAT